MYVFIRGIAAKYFSRGGTLLINSFNVVLVPECEHLFLSSTKQLPTVVLFDQLLITRFNKIIIFYLIAGGASIKYAPIINHQNLI